MSEPAAPQTNPDSLSASRTAEIDALNGRAWELRHSDPDRARSLAQEAYDRSAGGETGTGPYLQGRLSSLTTLGFLENQQGRLDRALALLFDAVPIADALPPGKATIEMYRMISWVTYFLGDLAASLSHSLTALRIADSLGLVAQKASILDSMAMTYAGSGDRPQALLRHQQALEMARSVGDGPLESSVLNNLANDLIGMGDLEGALANAQKSLEIARALQLPDLQVSTLDTIGGVLHQMGQSDRAAETLEEGLRLATQTGQKMGQVYCLLNLGKIQLSQGRVDPAAERIEAAVALAERLGARPVEADCWLLLSEIAEKRGQPGTALSFYRRATTLREKITAETSEKRLAALKVAHEVENAKRDAEIYRLRNVELQKQIEEHTRVQAELQRLATTDALTGINNRRHFFALATHETTRSARYKGALSILMIDVDHFKRINDSHGHAIGDQVLQLLSGMLLHQVRSVDILGRYGGEEFCVALPETGAAGGMVTAERICRAVAEQPFVTSAGKISVTVSIGVAELEQDAPAPLKTLDKLIDRADQALLAAKRNRNRVVLADKTGAGPREPPSAL